MIEVLWLVLDDGYCPPREEIDHITPWIVGEALYRKLQAVIADVERARGRRDWWVIRSKVPLARVAWSSEAGIAIHAIEHGWFGRWFYLMLAWDGQSLSVLSAGELPDVPGAEASAVELAKLRVAELYNVSRGSIAWED